MRDSDPKSTAIGILLAAALAFACEPMHDVNDPSGAHSESSPLKGSSSKGSSGKSSPPSKGGSQKAAQKPAATAKPDDDAIVPPPKKPGYAPAP